MNRKNEKIIVVFMILVFIIGLSLIVYYSNWQTALGVYLFAWFNNYELKNKLPKNKEK